MTFRIEISPTKTLRFFILIIAFLSTASFMGSISNHVFGHARVFGLIELFDVDRENSIPTWYSAVTLLLCAGLLLFITLHQRRTASRFIKYWTTLSVVFAYMSMDEVAAIHEKAHNFLQIYIDGKSVYYYTWVIPGSVFVVLFALLFIPFLRHLSSSIRRGFVLSGGLFVLGALGFEMVSGYFFLFDPGRGMTQAVLQLFEESLEMLGVAVFIATLLAYIKNTLGIHAFQLKSESKVSHYPLRNNKKPHPTIGWMGFFSTIKKRLKRLWLACPWGRP